MSPVAMVVFPVPDAVAAMHSPGVVLVVEAESSIVILSITTRKAITGNWGTTGWLVGKLLIWIADLFVFSCVPVNIDAVFGFQTREFLVWYCS